jgi:lambda family phage portal protein
MTTRFESVRTPAERVLHVYRVNRPGQIRGVPWLASAITRLKDFDDFEDAELMQQKVAACFGAFVTDMDGQPSALGVEATSNDSQPVDQLEPGHIEYLPPGKTITFATPPRTSDSGFSTRTLRRIAASIGITYEDMTGDYSQVTFSSARMGRIAHWQKVHRWRWQMLIPQLCNPVWCWAMELAQALRDWPTAPTVEWSAPPMPILEPDKEGLAWQRLLRIGAVTWPQMIRERGEDPAAQLKEIATANRQLDDGGIVLDSDPRKTNAAGMLQLAAQPIGTKPSAPGGSAPAPASEGAPTTDDTGGSDDGTDDAVEDGDESVGVGASDD